MLHTEFPLSLLLKSEYPPLAMGDMGVFARKPCDGFINSEQLYVPEEIPLTERVGGEAKPGNERGAGEEELRLLLVQEEVIGGALGGLGVSRLEGRRVEPVSVESASVNVLLSSVLQ